MSAGTGTEPTEEQTDARRAARQQLENLLLRLAVDGFGATRHEDPVEGYQLLTRTRMEPATAVVEAAVLLRDLSAGLVRRWAEDARGAGASWDAIGAALGLLQEGQSFNRAEAAFAHVATGEPLPENETDEWRPRYDPVRVSFRCAACGEYVRDSGPYGDHPEDQLTDHGEGCTIFAAVAAEWNARHGDDDL